MEPQNPFEDAKIVGKITHIPHAINEKIKENCSYIKSKINDVSKLQSSCEIKLPKTYKFPGIEPVRSTNLVYGVILKSLVDKGYKVSIDLSTDSYAILHISWPIDRLKEMNDELKKIVDTHLVKR